MQVGANQIVDGLSLHGKLHHGRGIGGREADNAVVNVPRVVVANAQLAAQTKRERVVAVRAFLAGVEGERVLSRRQAVGNEEVDRRVDRQHRRVATAVDGRARKRRDISAAVIVRVVKVQSTDENKLRRVVLELTCRPIGIGGGHRVGVNRAERAGPKHVRIAPVALDGSVLLDHHGRINLARGSGAAGSLRCSSLEDVQGRQREHDASRSPQKTPSTEIISLHERAPLGQSGEESVRRNQIGNEVFYRHIVL